MDELYKFTTYKERLEDAAASMYVAYLDYCENKGCWNKPTELHHSRGRNGKMLNLQIWWVALCSECLRKTHQDPNWARSVGLLCHKGEWLKAD